MVIDGKLLGHVISKEGIIIDPKRVKYIGQLTLPHNKKAVQSFFSKTNFVKKFILDFAMTINPLQLMMKKNLEFKWTQDDKESLEKIKTTISNAISLIILILIRISLFIPLHLIYPLMLYLPKEMKKEMSILYIL